MALHKGRDFVERAGTIAIAAATLLLSLATVRAADPTKIGLSLSLTGATAPAGRQVRAGLDIWRENVNAAGGLLGRQVELIYYDDRANPANAPGIYAKLMGVDKIGLLIGPYSTNIIAAALPAIIENKRMTIGIFGLGANKQSRLANSSKNIAHTCTRAQARTIRARQILAKTVSETKSLDDERLAEYIRGHAIDTVIGPMSFGEDGEWKTPRIIYAQFQNVSGNDIGHQGHVAPDRGLAGAVQDRRADISICSGAEMTKAARRAQ